MPPPHPTPHWTAWHHKSPTCETGTGEKENGLFQMLATWGDGRFMPSKSAPHFWSSQWFLQEVGRNLHGEEFLMGGMQCVVSRDREMRVREGGFSRGRKFPLGFILLVLMLFCDVHQLDVCDVWACCQCQSPSVWEQVVQLWWELGKWEWKHRVD